jgi:SnoaL-like domain
MFTPRPYFGRSPGSRLSTERRITTWRRREPRAWMRGDFEVALIRARMGLDLEASYRGRDGVRDFVQTYQGAFGDLTYEPQWIVDLAGDVFVMLLHQRLRGRASGASVEQVSAHRLELHDGLVVREEVFSAPGHDWTSLAQAVGLDPAELARRQRS